MALSVVSPIEPALARTRAILFRPFSAEKWFKLGFCAFLTTLTGNCGGSANGPLRGIEHAIDRGGEFGPAQWTVLAVIGVVALAVILTLWVLVLWLQSRGQFMFLDGVVRDRGAIKEPWSTYRAEGDSLFRFSLVLHTAFVVLTMGVMGLGLYLAWGDILKGRFEGGALAGLIVAVVPFLALVLAFFVVITILHDFVVPAMYQGRISVSAGWRVVRSEVLAGRAGTLALYLLMKLLISLVTSVLVMTLVCGTLCLALCVLMIPYIGAVALLPLLVFQRCYSLCFLEQLGGPWKLSGPTPPAEPGPA